jgi:hypothetical protein
MNRSLIRTLHALDEMDPDELVTVVYGGDHQTITVFTDVAGPIRLVEGRARVPASIARALIASGPGWSVEP